jgi:hypothetical protein
VTYPRHVATFRLPRGFIPTSKKNRPRRTSWIDKEGRSRHGVRPSDRWEQDEQLIRQEALAWFYENRAEVIPATHWIELTIQGHTYPRAKDDQVVIGVWDLGPDKRPSPSRGMGRDLVGLLEGIADSLQGIFYPDDKRIKKVTLERICHVKQDKKTGQDHETGRHG